MTTDVAQALPTRIGVVGCGLMGSGIAEVVARAGLDVVADATALRSQIGLAGQYAAVDENLTGHENLEMVGRLYHLGKTK